MKRAALFCILSNLSISLLVYGSHIKHPYSRVDLTIAKQANFLQSWWHWRRFLGRKPSVQLALLVILLMWLLHFKSSKMLKVLSMDFSLLVRECADLVGRSSSISVSCSLCNISLRWISCNICRPKVLVIWDLLGEFDGLVAILFLCIGGSHRQRVWRRIWHIQEGHLCGIRIVVVPILCLVVMPESTWALSECLPSTTTLIVRFCRNDDSHWCIFP
jgi:hypothetical protein